MVKISDIINSIGSNNFSSKGNWKEDKDIIGVNNILNCSSDQITFCKYIGTKGVKLINECKDAGVIISSIELVDTEFENQNSILIFVDNPRKTFIQIYNEHFLEPDNKTDIHSTASIEPTASIGNNVKIGKYTTIGENVSIGDNTRIYNGVHIYDNVTIGSNCIIDSGAVIGGEGFGFERDNEKVYKFPQLGRVIIGNHVEIGANSCIDRGALVDTIIEDYVKIDNLVHVGHNVRIKRNSFLIALSMIGGSTEIGENVWIAPSSAVTNGIKVGKNSTIGIGAVVLKDVEKGTTVFGNPARQIKSNLSK